MITEVAIPQHQTLPQLQTGDHSRFDDLVQRRMHIASCLVNNPSNTFYFNVDDDQMKFFSISKGSIVVVDKSIEVISGSLIVCCVDDEWLIRKLVVKAGNKYLCINNSMDASLNITGKEVYILGVVTWNCLPYINS